MDAFLEYDPGLHPCSTGVKCRSRLVIPHADGAVDNSLMWVVAMAVRDACLSFPRQQKFRLYKR